MNNNTCNCNLFEFMAKDVGIKVLHPGGYESTKELCSNCDIRENSHVLDIACGTGTTSFFLNDKYNCKVTGIDIDEILINKAKSKLYKDNLNRKIDFKLGNALKLPFADNTFDVVISQAFFVLVEEQELALSEIYRVLKPGGYFGALELSWFSHPDNEIKSVLKNRTCNDIIPRIKTFDEWKTFFTANKLLHTKTSRKEMDMGMMKFLKSEGFINFSKIMYKMISSSKRRGRMMDVQKTFSKYSNYLGYGIYNFRKNN